MPENSGRQQVIIQKPNIGGSKLEDSCNQMGNLSHKQGLSQNRGDIDTDGGNSIRTNPNNQSRFEKLEKYSGKENLRDTVISFEVGSELNNTDPNRKIYADEDEQLEIPRDENNRNRIETVLIGQEYDKMNDLHNSSRKQTLQENSISGTSQQSKLDEKENLSLSEKNNHNKRKSDSTDTSNIIKKTNKIGLVKSHI